jgi:streptogramin lyase
MKGGKTGTKTIIPIGSFGLIVIFILGLATSSSLIAAESFALTGKVTSQEEGVMEGVVVSAKREDSTITVSVVSDSQGQYGFPEDRMEPGIYAISMRAIGYELTNPGPVELTVETTYLDLQLTQTDRLSEQLSNTEWLISMPATGEQRHFLNGSCTMCHTLQRPLRSRYEPEQMAKVVQRMSTHTLNSTIAHPHFKSFWTQVLSNPPTQRQTDMGRFISSINLSTADTWQFPLKTLPRPTGKATKVVVTTYDLPRPDAAPHDTEIGPDGNIWYVDFVSPYIGKLDPKTGEVTEYSLPIQKPGYAVGGLNIAIGQDGMIYATTMHQAQVVRLDPKTEEMETFLFPYWDVDSIGGDARVTMVDPSAQLVDGHIWVNAYRGGERGIIGEAGLSYQVNLETNQWTPVIQPPGSPAANAYDIVADSKNNLYGMYLYNDNIWKIDPVTLETTFYEIPTPGAGGRRGHVDFKDRLWWGQFAGNGIGMFDPETEKITEWQMPTPWTNPYDAEFDDKAYVWTGGMNNDLAVRLNVETGEFTEYLLPFETNIRHVDVQKSGNPYGISSFWVEGQLNAHIVHIEPYVP